ncbi:MATE family efflux transporter [Maribius pontilimi]|uniref:MATE family efflux transporter n=2 Tax=Palleronia pontilimi TaxID=1964209 RepID=A0A934ICE1_9RHOB|nr:MATE family efflux transporter [Palleronia pontilimi]
MVFGILGVISVGLADAYFLGRVGQAELAAVGFFFPVATAVTSLSIGLSAGVNAALSQTIGRGEEDSHTNRVAFHALGLGLAIATLVGLTLWAVDGWIFRLMGATDATLPEIADYMFYWCLSFPLLVTSMLLGSMFRAHGNAITASIIMAAQSVFNIALDPVLIFGLGPFAEMGTGGAGLATLLARLLAVIGGLIWAFRQGYITICTKPMKGLWSSAKQIFEVGLPAAFSNAINPMGMAAVTAAVATLGEAAVAGYGAATRIQTLALVPMLALSSGIGPVIGQNWGADEKSRVRGAMRFTFLICLGYGAVLGATLLIFGETFAGFIASGPEDTAFATTYLRIVGFSLFGYGVLVTANAAMNARSKATFSMGLSLGRIFLLYIPLAWALVALMGFTGIAIAAATANVVAACAALILTRATGILGLDVAVVRVPGDRLAKATDT